MFLPKDKVTLKFLAATVEAGKLEKALDLVFRLHLEQSFDLAMVIADKHRRLVDLIEDARDRKFGREEEEFGEETPEFDDFDDDHRQRITPDGPSRVSKRAFEDDVDEGTRRVRSRHTFA